MAENNTENKTEEIKLTPMEEIRKIVQNQNQTTSNAVQTYNALKESSHPEVITALTNQKILDLALNDATEDWNSKLSELYQEAEVKRAKIRELEAEIN